ncbi:MAG: hypothetical protein LBB72_09645 [Spirochaetaceae bacterium]|nr:hypothetical protein [Spirochaetaceae bacterium]
MAHIAFIFLIYITGTLGAQAESSAMGFFQGWQLYHSEGDITITQGGARTIYRAGTERPREILLIPQDMIQTGKGAAEIQLVTGAAYQPTDRPPTDKPPAQEKTYTIIKMSENTSLLINRSENKEITLELLYGRTRVITGTAEPGIVFRAGASVTTLQNCDTAIDYIIRPGTTQPVLSLHCFYGQGEVIPRFTQGTEAARFSLKADETFSLEYRIPYSYVERRSLDSQILAYWQSNPFTPGAPLPIPQTELSAREKPEAEMAQTTTRPPQTAGSPAGTQAAGTAEANNAAQTDSTPQTSDSPKIKRAKGINVVGLITGVLFVSGGAALQAYCYYGNPDSTLKKPLFYSGFGPIGLGTLFVIGSIINPTE